MVALCGGITAYTEGNKSVLTNQGKAFWGRLALLGAALIWGSSFIVMKNAVSGVPVFLLLAFRFTVGFGLLAVIFWRKLREASRSGLLHGAICGVLLFLAYTLQTFGLKGTTAGKNAFLTAVYCVLVPFVEWTFFRSRPTKWNWAAALMCLTGIGLVSLSGDLTISWGDGLTLLGGVMFTFHLMAISRFSRKDDPIMLTQVQFGIAGICCWLCSLMTETMPSQLPAGALGELIYLAIFATTAAMLLQNVGQSVTPAAQVSILLCLESVFGVMFSVWVGGEVLTLRLICGFALIFVAVVASETGFSFLKVKTKKNISI